MGDFTKAARSVTSSKPPYDTRYRATRKGIQPPKKPTGRNRPSVSTQRPSDDHTPLVTIPIRASEREQHEEDLSEDNQVEIPAQTPGPISIQTISLDRPTRSGQSSIFGRTTDYVYSFIFQGVWMDGRTTGRVAPHYGG